MVPKPETRERVCEEFKGVSLSDERLSRRLEQIVEAVGVAPERSFPELMSSSAELEGAYRFFGNPAVDPHQMLAPHVAQTHLRMKGHALCRAVHDSTDLHYRGERQDLGSLSGSRGAGYVAHLCLAVSGGEPSELLGVLGFSTLVHKEGEARRGLSKMEVDKILKATPRAQKESSRWERLAIEVSSQLPEGMEVVHVMDQEADDYALLGELEKAKLRFVVRGHLSRETKRGQESIADVLSKQAFTVFRTVEVSERTEKKAKGRHPVRKQRQANLSIRWTALNIRKTRWAQSDVPSLNVYAVHVLEQSPPEGEEPIEWLLLTNEVVETLEQATAIVDHYRARWVIEEFNKALKTGCAIEKRQLTTLDGLVRVLALFLPMAWHLFVLRHLSREEKPRPATSIFTAEQLLLLGALLSQRRSDFKLPAEPSVRHAMLGIAALGGHIRNNGDPGWLILGRGYQAFLDACSVMALVKQM